MAEVLDELESSFEWLTVRWIKRSGQARTAFIEISKLIVHAWNDKKDVTGRRKVDGETANEWFKRQAYRLIRRYVLAGKDDLFERIIKKHGRHPAGRNDIRDHPFKMGLLAMFPSAKGMRRDERRRFAEDMLYAHRHKIKPEMLNAFASRVGNTEEVKRKLKDRHREPGFKDPKGA